MGSFHASFWYLDFGPSDAVRKTKHEGTKEDQDPKNRRRSISARGAQKWIISLCALRLRVLVVGLMNAPVAEADPVGKVTRQ